MQMSQQHNDALLVLINELLRPFLKKKKKLFTCWRSHVSTACLSGYPMRTNITVPQINMHYWLCGSIATIGTTCANVVHRSPLMKASTLWMWSVHEIYERFPTAILALKRPTHSYTFCRLVVYVPYCVNTRRWLSAVLIPSVHRKCTTVRCFSMMQSLSGSSIPLASLLVATPMDDEWLREV